MFFTLTPCSKQQHIVDEMVSTEREYVRSLRYVTQQYFPEMERPDLPQELRGQRCVVFGNLENILDFHSQFFLKELEACWRHPLRVAQCFLRYVGTLIHAEADYIHTLYKLWYTHSIHHTRFTHCTHTMHHAH